MSELKEIFEGWAGKKYPFAVMKEHREAYTAACNDFVDVFLKFGMHCVTKNLWVIDEAALLDFLKNVYNQYKNNQHE